jgi:hypothetical protein
MSATEIGNAAIRESMNEGLAKLSGGQLDLFRRMYGEHVPDEKLSEAHDVIQRTLRKMEARGAL